MPPLSYMHATLILNRFFDFPPPLHHLPAHAVAPQAEEERGGDDADDAWLSGDDIDDDLDDDDFIPSNPPSPMLADQIAPPTDNRKQLEHLNNDRAKLGRKCKRPRLFPYSDDVNLEELKTMQLP